MNAKEIISFAKKHQGMAVVAIFKDPDDDWRHFRIERVEDQRIAFTGMTADDGTHHDGSFFWAEADEIRRIYLRDV
jgi:hypothetical protein